jgi:hypothetical protein
MGVLRDIERGVRHGVGGIARGATDWLKNPTKETQQLARRIGGGIKKYPVEVGAVLGGAAGAATGYAANMLGKQPKGPKGGTDPRLTGLRGEMVNEAKDFKRNLGQYRDDQYQGLLSAANQARDTGTRQIREGMSSRGLLYSGMRAGKESELQSGLESGLAQGRYDINRESSALLKKKQLAAQMVGLDSLNQLQNSIENYYNLQMQNQMARRQAFGQLASGLGYAAGAYFGGQQSPSSQTNWEASTGQRGMIFDWEPQYGGNRTAIGQGMLNAKPQRGF